MAELAGLSVGFPSETFLMSWNFTIFVLISVEKIEPMEYNILNKTVKDR